MRVTQAFIALVLVTVLTVPGASWAEIDRVIVVKSKRQMTLMHDGKVVHNFKVSLGREPVGAKQQAGDGRTPEGRYTLTGRNEASRFHRSIRVSYPSPAERVRARTEGVDPGGDIMIHGLSRAVRSAGPGHYRLDWTEGCIAVTDAEMDVIWADVPADTPIEILP